MYDYLGRPRNLLYTSAAESAAEKYHRLEGEAAVAPVGRFEALRRRIIPTGQKAAYNRLRPRLLLLIQQWEPLADFINEIGHSGLRNSVVNAYEGRVNIDDTYLDKLKQFRNNLFHLIQNFHRDEQKFGLSDPLQNLKSQILDLYKKYDAGINEFLQLIKPYDIRIVHREWGRAGKQYVTPVGSLTPEEFRREYWF